MADSGAMNAPRPVLTLGLSDSKSQGDALTIDSVKDAHLNASVVLKASHVTVRARILHDEHY